MPNDGNHYTHYIVKNGRILGEAKIIEKLNHWISLALVKLGTGSKQTTDYAFVENHTLVSKIPN